MRRQHGSKARQAKLELRFGTVELMRARWLRSAQRMQEAAADSVALHLVDVSEIGARAGTEQLHWRLLTTHTIDTTQAALEIVQWYSRRWNIEQLFWNLKREGLDIEASKVESANALVKLAFLAKVAATRIMQLVRVRDGTQQVPASVVLTVAEIETHSHNMLSLVGKTAKQKNAHNAGSLDWESWIIARLGG